VNKSPIWKITVTWKTSRNKSIPVQFSPYQVIGNRSTYLTLTINYTQHNWLQFTIRAHGQDSKLDTKTAESGHCGPANYKSTDNVAVPARYINNAEGRYPQPGPARQIQDTHCAFCQKQPLCLSLSLSLPDCISLLELWIKYSLGVLSLTWDLSLMSCGQRNRLVWNVVLFW